MAVGRRAGAVEIERSSNPYGSSRKCQFRRTAIAMQQLGLIGSPLDAVRAVIVEEYKGAR